MKILVAGGAGYIGMHTCVVLIEAGHDVVIIDSLINSQSKNIERIQEISNRKIPFFRVDVRDKPAVSQLFNRYEFDAVINFAGHKAVGESVDSPLEYYANNLNCALTLLECMTAFDVKVLVFSSSAAVYGKPDKLPIIENARIAPQSPYGRTKQFIEEMLKDVSYANCAWKIANLRYFNPVGAHPSGLIGESPNGTPNNLVPYIAQVAAGQQGKLQIFGGDYDTPDGTGIRDYIHVMDLARGHVHALEALERMNNSEVLTLNLGTGKGHSVLEMVNVFEEVSGQKIPFEIVNRREGDVASCYADPSLAKREIDWEAELGISDMCKDAWNWQLQLCNTDAT